MKAYPIAVKLASGLGLKGFLLNMQVEKVNDIVSLKSLFPKIRSSVGDEKCQELERILYEK